MTEAQFQTLFGRWLRRGWKEPGAFELKVVRGERIPFRAVAPHQLSALLASESLRGLTYKIPDDSVGYKPFDCFTLKHVRSWVVVRFNTDERGNREFFMIRPSVWKEESETSLRRSLSRERAMSVGTVRSL